ncbi:hypothetical protein NFI96_029739 [Prochilodus magdalenae]|nr:hypothetical protein NFI96_029739 [Prochilodus magdalenae]
MSKMSPPGVPRGGSLLSKIKLYTKLFDSNVSELQALIDKLKGITDGLEATHRSTTIGSLSGGVIGAAGGITSIVGAILAPFTLGASLIVTGVGIGVAVAGGVTGAVSNITDMVRQKTSRQEIEEILNTFQKIISPIIKCLKDIEVLLNEVQAMELNESSTQRIQAIFGITRGAGHAVELIRLVNVVEMGKVAAQVSRTVRAAAAMTGVVSGLFLLFDIAFITKDVIELRQIDKEKKDGRRSAKTRNPKMSSTVYRRIYRKNSADSDSSADSNLSIEQPPSIEHCVPEDGSLLTNINLYTTPFDSNVSELQALIGKLTGITDGLETTHRSATIGSLTWGLIGAAGGITSIVGAILAPFTLGTSLIVTGVGIGVAVIGGVTGAVSNITDMVRQKTSRQEIEEILNTFQKIISPIIKCLKDIEVLLNEVQTMELNESSTQRIQAIFGATRGTGHAAELIRLVNFAEIGAVAAQISRTLRVAAAMTGVISGLFLLFDIAFIIKDIKELREIYKEEKDGSETSDIVKFIQEMRNTCDHLTGTVKELRGHRKKLNTEITAKLQET